MAQDPSKHAGRYGRGSVVFFLFTLLVLAAAVLAFFRLQGVRAEKVQTEARARAQVQEAGRRVQVVSAARAPTERRLELIGEARPYSEVTLFAKVSGYLREIKVDKGDRVTRGQVLAVIESPELDRQYDAAVADAKGKDQDARRAWALLPKGGASREQAENREAAAQVARANVASLQAQKDYEIIRAPIDGVVTARFVDPGALIQNAGNSQGTASPVVTVSQVSRLRVRAYADQKNAGDIRVGSRADIWDVTRPQNKVSGVLSRTSVQLSARTRTLLIELDVDNRKGIFVPGSFVQVSLLMEMPSHVEIPAEALLFRENKPVAAVLGQESRVSLRPIVIAESNGTMVRLESGVQEGEKVVLNGGEGTSEGELVQPQEAH